ncbi:unnamed protein product [Phytomonas sp. Hart1]|nr:unnamed protein product [Phytomonas sp. Hart1]|eukprot:CCW66408.1 unnamed protein product [Phytomonas sp. isolate Hart1]
MSFNFDASYSLNMDSNDLLHGPIACVISKTLPPSTKITPRNSGRSSNPSEKNPMNTKRRMRVESYPRGSPSSSEEMMEHRSRKAGKRPTAYLDEDPLPIRRDVLRGPGQGRHENSAGSTRTSENSDLFVEGSSMKSKSRNHGKLRRHSTSPETVVEHSPLHLPDITQPRHVPYVVPNFKTKEGIKERPKGSPCVRSDHPPSGDMGDHSNDIFKRIPINEKRFLFSKLRTENKIDSTRHPHVIQKQSLEDGRDHLNSYNVERQETLANDAEAIANLSKDKHIDMMLKFRHQNKDGVPGRRSSQTFELKNNRAPPLDVKLLKFLNFSTGSTLKGEVEKEAPSLSPQHSPKFISPQPRQRRIHSIPQTLERENRKAVEMGIGAIALTSGSSNTSDSIKIAPPYSLVSSETADTNSTRTKSEHTKTDEDYPLCEGNGIAKTGKSELASSYNRMNSLSMSEHLQYSYTMLTAEVASDAESTKVVDSKSIPEYAPLHPFRRHDLLNEWQNNVQVLSFQPIRMRGGDFGGRYHQLQWYPRPQSGQVKPEVAGESIEMNEQLHNDIIHLIQKRRALVLEYPSVLPCKLDEMVRQRRPRTPRSFYGPPKPHVGKDWFRDAMKHVKRVLSPDFSKLDKDDRTAERDPQIVA